jgi:hypothetical protein
MNGPFDMHTDHAGHPGGDRGIGSIERGSDMIGRIADQRRQESGGSEPGVRRTDRGNAFDADIVVEQHPAAAIDLRIDETGHQPATVKVDIGAAADRGIDRGDAAIGHVDRRRGEHGAAHHDTAIGDAQLHRVLVTLLRKGGRSGSKPRATDSCAAKA